MYLYIYLQNWVTYRVNASKYARHGVYEIGSYQFWMIYSIRVGIECYNTRDLSFFHRIIAILQDLQDLILPWGMMLTIAAINHPPVVMVVAVVAKSLRPTMKIENICCCRESIRGMGLRQVAGHRQPLRPGKSWEEDPEGRAMDFPWIWMWTIYSHGIAIE